MSQLTRVPRLNCLVRAWPVVFCRVAPAPTSTLGSPPARASAICALATVIRAARIFRSIFPAIALLTRESRDGSPNCDHHCGEMASFADTLGAVGRDQVDFAGASGCWYSGTRILAHPHSNPAHALNKTKACFLVSPVRPPDSFLFATVPDAVVRRKLLLTLRGANSAARAVAW